MLNIENEIIRSSSPIQLNESEEIYVCGERGFWVNKEEVEKWQGHIPINEYKLNEDDNPEQIIKTIHKPVRYSQNVWVKYLKPPPPPNHGDLIIRQENDVIRQPAPPVIIRQHAPRSKTPEPIVYRELPPTRPEVLPQQVVTLPGRVIEPTPRRVIIEKMPELPPKPQPIIIEKWLPYEKQKRRVVFENRVRNKSCENVRNLIIRWNRPHSVVNQEIKCLGVENADPKEYVNRYGKILKHHDELPVEMDCNCCQKFLNENRNEFAMENDVKVTNNRVGLTRHTSIERLNRQNTFLVVLRKSDCGDYGMVIRGGKEFNMSLYVLRIVCGGSACSDERLIPGDEILEINGQSTSSMRLCEAVQRIKSRNTVCLLVKRTGLPPPTVYDVLNAMGVKTRL